jgi:hypothetical protein
MKISPEQFESITGVLVAGHWYNINAASFCENSGHYVFDYRHPKQGGALVQMTVVPDSVEAIQSPR